MKLIVPTQLLFFGDLHTAGFLQSYFTSSRYRNVVLFKFDQRKLTISGVGAFGLVELMKISFLPNILNLIVSS